MLQAETLECFLQVDKEPYTFADVKRKHQRGGGIRSNKNENSAHEKEHCIVITLKSGKCICMLILNKSATTVATLHSVIQSLW